MRDRLSGFLRTLSALAGAAAGVLLILIMVVIVSDVVGRQVFNRPVPGAFEIVRIALLATVFLGFAYTEAADEHITVTILFDRLRPSGKRWFIAISGLLSTATAAVLTWQLYGYQQALARQGRTTGVLRLPLELVVAVATVGSGIFTLALAASLLRRFRLVTARTQSSNGDVVSEGPRSAV